MTHVHTKYLAHSAFSPPSSPSYSMSFSQFSFFSLTLSPARVASFCRSVGSGFTPRACPAPSGPETITKLTTSVRVLISVTSPALWLAKPSPHQQPWTETRSCYRWTLVSTSGAGRSGVRGARGRTLGCRARGSGDIAPIFY